MRTVQCSRKEHFASDGRTRNKNYEEEWWWEEEEEIRQVKCSIFTRAEYLICSRRLLRILSYSSLILVCVCVIVNSV